MCNEMAFNWSKLKLHNTCRGSTIHTRQQKNVTCQIDKDTNLYYKTPICIYAWIIINALNETEDA